MLPLLISPQSLILLLLVNLASASPVPWFPSRRPLPYTPPHSVFSTVSNRTFQALPPMSNPNRPILHSAPGFLAPAREIDLVDLTRTGPDVTANKEYDGKPTSGRSRKLPAITRVDTDTGMFYDELGNVRVFRGMAVSYKIGPYHPNLTAYDPIMSFAEDDMLLFDKLNLNIVRLGISWAAVQPSKGPDGFDLEYLAKIKEMVVKCESAGLYVLIECHQDLFAEKFMGDGAPAWAITRDWSTLPFPMPMHGLKRAVYDEKSHPDSAPINMAYSDDWGLEYGSDAVTRAFWGLYTDSQGVQGEFVRFWGKLAETFTGMGNVIGYEILNEPFIAARSTLHLPLATLTRSDTERSYLQPMYDRVEAAIRTHDDRALIFYEPVCGSGGYLGDGFSKTPGDRPDKAVFSFHSYGPNAVDRLTMEDAVVKGISQAKRLGGASMLTEFDVEATKGQKHLLRVMNLFDQNRLSWIGWQYKQFIRVAGSPSHGSVIDPRTGVYRSGMCKLFSRPFPSSVTGSLEGFYFNFTSSELSVVITPPVETSKQAEIVISVTEEDDWGWDGQWRLLHVTREDGERVGVVRVATEKELEMSSGEGVRWWVENGWVVGSKLVKVRLGTEWQGRAEIVVGLRGGAKIRSISEESLIRQKEAA